MVFCSGGILVSSGQWWLGFFWVFVLMGFSGLIISSNWFDGLCMCGSVDGLCLCVCGFVVVGLWLKWLVLLGFRWVFFFFFFQIWVFVPMGFW